ncbi:MAG: hypothetical protein ACYC96_07970 [Fimbriimonadaceae bacterium]
MSEASKAYNETSESLQRLAVDFLCRQGWCSSVRVCVEILVANGFFNLYWADFEPCGGATSPVWIIVGNLPPAFIFADADPEGDSGSYSDRENDLRIYGVLQTYASTLEEWVAAVERGETDLTPYPPIMYRNGTRELDVTPETVNMVRDKIRVLRSMVLPDLLEAMGLPNEE